MRSILFLWTVWIGLGAGAGGACALGADESLLEATELESLRTYVADLARGRPGNAARVDEFSDGGYAALQVVIQAYSALPANAEGHTHRALQDLLERMTRSALAPWPMITLYSPHFAEFLIQTGDKATAARTLFNQLASSGTGRRAMDLAVRVTPVQSLEYLADSKSAARQGEVRIGLLQAWQRRLSRGRESRPLPGLDDSVLQIAGQFSLDVSAEELEALLGFMAGWPVTREAYGSALEQALSSDVPAQVLAGLSVQQKRPQHLERNATLVDRWLPRTDADSAKIVESAIRNYAYDHEHDHAATLRTLWSMLKPAESKARYACLFAMGTHFRGNADIALDAVIAEPFAYIDVASPVLEHGGREQAVKAVRSLLKQSERSHEEALRLARKLELPDFVDDAVRIALDKKRDQILRQTALRYLQLANGYTRKRLLSFLSEPNGDLRLVAIQMYARREGLSAEDLDEIGPALIRVAQQDRSLGHRQEAIFTLALWKERSAEEFFQSVLTANPRVKIDEGHYNDSRYWQYRLRLVALVGLGRLGSRSARDELLDIHKQGGPTERMDVLLAFHELDEVPEGAWEDLKALEPKLVATAVHLIAMHGTAADKQKLGEFFLQNPLWLEFRDSGIDDHNILVGVQP